MPKFHREPGASAHVIAWADLIPQPWRNGGGVTRQILCMRLSASGEAEQTTADGWDWRLSIADVRSAGPFSSFPGMTRILTVIEGAALTLTVNGGTLELERYRPFRFDGAVETSATLPRGPIRDLNLIARTGTVDATVSVTTFSADHPQQVSNGEYCVLLDGSATLRGSIAKARLALTPYDTVAGNATHPLMISGEGTLAVITVHACV